MVKPKRMGPVS